MNFPLLVARRYLFAKRHTNAINIITGISVFGVSIGTAALILVLSVFNGFEDLLAGLFGHFNPEIKVTPAKGKTMQVDSVMLVKIKGIAGVAVVSQTLEEIAFFEYEGSQDFGVLKGVDNDFSKVNGIDSTLREGVYKLAEEDRNYAVAGAGVRNKLSINVDNFAVPITVYMPVEQSTGVLDKPFKTRILYPAGTFAIQQDYDNQYILTNLLFMRELLGVSDSTVSSLELKCVPGASLAGIKDQVRALLGADFVVKDAYEQNEAFFKVMRLEKWMGFAFTLLMLVLMAFNTIGAMWMIVLDKQQDIAILKTMGATDRMIYRIFMLEGILLTFLGLIIGFILAVVIYVIQKEYGIITIPEGFLVTSYPISMRFQDFFPVVFAVMSIGILASIAPALRAVRVPTYFRAA